MTKNNSKNGAFEEELNLREILVKYLSRWKWFAFSLLVCYAAAFSILRYTPINYESKTKLLIQFEKAGTYSELSAFQDLGLFDGIGGYNNLYNEKEILQSRPLLEQVVRKLDLNIQYFLIGTKTGIERKEFYKNSPIKIDIIAGDSADINTASLFNIEVLNSEYFKFVDTEGFSNKKYKFGDTLQGAFGKFSIWTTPLYQAKNGTIRINIRVSSIEATVSQYQARLKIEPINENVDILQLSIRGSVIKKNNDFLDSLITVHTQQTIVDQLKIYRNTTRFINERVDAISDELSHVEKDGEEYKTQYEFSDILLSEKSLYDRTLVNEKKLVDSEIQLKLIDLLLIYINEHPDNDELLPANLGFDDMSINDAVVQYNKLALEKMRALNYSSEKNPTVIKLENDLNNIKSSLRVSLQNLKSSMIIEVNDLQSKEFLLNTDITSLPKHKRVLRSIERQQQVKESLYLYLLQKREENEIASAVTEGNSKLIENAYSSGGAVSPNRKMYYAAAFFFGMFIPFSVIFISGLLDNKVRSKEDLNKYDLTHLCSVPFVKGDQKLVISKGNTTPEAEAFRILRTNTSFLLNNSTDQGKIILTSSTIAKEGKSFVALNLATSYALTGKKTIIVGLDLRAPKVMEYAGMADTKGVTDYILNDQLTLNDIISASPVTENLFFLPSGIKPPNPAELLMRPEVTQLFEKLKKEFEIVIIDTAPVGLVTDTLLISHLADAFIYVVRANYLDKKSLALPDQLIREEKIKNVGVVINAIDTVKLGNYGYGYGYGYEGHDTQQKWYQRLLKRS